ncbi:MAG: sorbosone dehydrogenase [Bacteroidetes bacterium 43-93]|nr:sorbosone dehydrogenase family protein [Bacteroidota bacterium]OJW97478.1 MAG: sorbosone dehydrogenase [Bacteroidetes bacterium 43-93]
MNLQSRVVLSIVSLLALCSSCHNTTLQKVTDPRLADIKMPPGFHISIFADSVKDARSLALGDKGTVFVGNKEEDKVYALVDKNKDGIADEKYIVASGLTMPNGVAFRKGSLYIAEVDKIWRIDNIEQSLAHPAKPILVSNNFPYKKYHGWKYIAFGPDDKLYVPVGAPCNICNDNEQDERFASITRMNPDGTGFEVFANGIRNSVGFDWDPQTHDLWFTDNGRDMLGDDIPADELNHAPQKDMNFGYPYCHQGDILDPEFGAGYNCKDFTPPVAKLAAHTAALGMKFYTGNMFPAEYRERIFIAEHGSWNRSVPQGYRITTVELEDGKLKKYSVFAEGWLKNGKAWGRPVSVLQLQDGSLLVSDDYAGIIYRITYGNNS